MSEVEYCRWLCDQETTQAKLPWLAQSPYLEEFCKPLGLIRRKSLRTLVPFSQRCFLSLSESFGYNSRGLQGTNISGGQIDSLWRCFHARFWAKTNAIFLEDVLAVTLDSNLADLPPCIKMDEDWNFQGCWISNSESFRCASFDSGRLCGQIYAQIASNQGFDLKKAASQVTIQWPLWEGQNDLGHRHGQWRVPHNLTESPHWSAPIGSWGGGWGWAQELV